MKHINPILRRGLAVLALWGSALTLSAQQRVAPPRPAASTGKTTPAPCGTTEAARLAEQRNPALAVRRQLLAAYLQQRAQQVAGKEAPTGPTLPPFPTTPPVYRIPVVFHIFYTSDPTNAYGSPQSVYVDANRVQTQLNVLNADFRRLNADAANMPADFGVNPADAGIEFCLATRDPQGNVLAEPGIDRFNTSVTDYGAFYDPTSGQNNAYPKLRAVGGVDAWDPVHYLNVWVCSLRGSGVYGVGIFPNQATAAEDGILIQTNVFGKNTAPTNVYQLAPYHQYGRTLTHEVGHYLGLHHIWGDDQFPSCSDSDGVADTPNQYDASSNNSMFPVVPSYQNSPGNACSNTYPGDMFMNYMDYVADNAMYMFTPGQAANMRALFNPATPSNRAELLNSLALAPTTAVAFTHNLPTSLTLCTGDQTPYRFRVVQPALCTGSYTYQWTVPSGWSINSPTFGAPTITPDGVTGGTVTLTSTYHNGSATVTYTSSVTVGITPAPSAPVFTGGGDVCPTQAVTFTVAPVPNASGYQWTVPAGFSPTGTVTTTGPSLTLTAPSASSATAYSLSVQSLFTTGSCAASAPTSTTFTVTGSSGGPFLVADARSGQRYGYGIPLTCANQTISVALTGAPPSAGYHNYVWTVNGAPITAGQGTTQIDVLTPAPGGYFEVFVRFLDACGNPQVPSSGRYDAQSVSSINGLPCQAPSQARAYAYPNPADASLTLDQLTGPVVLYNGQGKVVYQGSGGKTVRVETSHLPNGLYQLVGQDLDHQKVQIPIQITH
jgi:hypothetical protein